MTPTIYLGADHGGFAHKEFIKKKLLELSYTVEDLGAFSEVEDDDYPEYALAVAKKVADSHQEGNAATGILLCRSGAGMTIAANKVAGIRAVNVSTVDLAKHARVHNDANVLALSADELKDEQMWKVLLAFLETPFSQEERHIRRIALISEFEKKAP